MAATLDIAQSPDPRAPPGQVSSLGSAPGAAQAPPIKINQGYRLTLQQGLSSSAAVVVVVLSEKQGARVHVYQFENQQSVESKTQLPFHDERTFPRDASESAAR